MAGLDLVTAPTVEPLTLAQAKDHCRVDGSDDDTLLTDLIGAARSRCEAFLKQSLLQTAWAFRIDGGFPPEIRLPVGPLIDTASVSIAYVDDAGASQTLDGAVYDVSGGETGVIRAAYGQSWPSARPVMDAVTVTFTAGVAAAANLPPAIVHAVRMTLAEMYENREESVPGSLAEVPLSARNLMMPFVRHD